MQSLLTGNTVSAHHHGFGSGIPKEHEIYAGAVGNDTLCISAGTINKYLGKQFYDYFAYLEATDLMQYRRSCDAIKFYYTAMQRYIKSTIQ